MIRICISSVAGETLDIECQATDTIADVKHIVARTWSIPLSCQKLLTDAEVLEDEAIIERCMRSNAISVSGLFVLTVVVSLDVVRSSINSDDTNSDDRAAKRVFALEELGILGLKGGSAGIAMVVNCLEEKDERVCRAAIEALGKFATKGNQHIIAPLILKLKHKRSNVKKVALEFLGQLTEAGDRNVVIEVCACLEQHVTSAEVTAAAIETLGTLALQGDPDYVVAQVINLLGHKSKHVRKTAVQALAKLAERGITISVPVLKGCLGDTQSEVRIAALKAIAKISAKGDRDALAAVSVCVADVESSVRLSALCAIAEIAEKGDEKAFAYSRLFGQFKRKSGAGASTSSDETGARLPPPGTALDTMSQSSHASSSVASSALTSHGQGDGGGDCSGMGDGMCNRRDGNLTKCIMQ